MNFTIVKQVRQQYPRWRFRCTPVAVQGVEVMPGLFTRDWRFLFEATQVVKVYLGRGNGARLPDRLLALAVFAPTVTQAFEELLLQLQLLERKALEGR